MDQTSLDGSWQHTLAILSKRPVKLITTVRDPQCVATSSFHTNQHLRLPTFECTMYIRQTGPLSTASVLRGDGYDQCVATPSMTAISLTYSLKP